MRNIIAILLFVLLWFTLPTPVQGWGEGYSEFFGPTRASCSQAEIKIYDMSGNSVTVDDLWVKVVNRNNNSTIIETTVYNVNTYLTSCLGTNAYNIMYRANKAGYGGIFNGRGVIVSETTHFPINLYLTSFETASATQSLPARNSTLTTKTFDRYIYVRPYANGGDIEHYQLSGILYVSNGSPYPEVYPQRNYGTSSSPTSKTPDASGRIFADTVTLTDPLDGGYRYIYDYLDQESPVFGLVIEGQPSRYWGGVSEIIQFYLEADLTSDPITVNGDLTPGSRLTFTGTFRNASSDITARASTGQIRIDIGNDGTWNNVLDNPAVPQLSPGASQTATSSAWTAASGTHRVEFCANYNNVIYDSNIANDCSSQVFTVAPQSYSWTGYVRVDTNENCVLDGSESVYTTGATLDLSGGATATGTTNSSGYYTFTDLLPDNYTMTLTAPSGHRISSCNTNTISRNLTADSSDYFYITPNTLNGVVYEDMNENATQNVSEEGVSGLTVTISGPVNRSATTNANGDYTFSALPNGTYSVSVDVTTSDYTVTSTNPVSVSISNSNRTANFGVFPKYTWSGAVFVDANENNTKDANEANYAETPTITLTNKPSGSPDPIITRNSDGTYLLRGLISGEYAVQYSNPPAGYLITHPRPSTFLGTVGTSCSPASNSPSGSCNNNNLLNVNYALRAGDPWIQAYGQSIRMDDGIYNPIPPEPDSACVGSYMSVPGSSATPGIIHSGATNPRLGFGQASSQNWVVGDLTYPDLFKPVPSGVIRTSYGYFQSTLKRSGITPTDLSTVCTLSNCSLPLTLASGIYQANGPVNLNAATISPGRQVVFLINGDLTIRGAIDVPVSSTATFSVAGDIIVTPTVGRTAACPAPADAEIDGLFSADRSFIIQSSSDCASSTPDRQLNVQGSIVVNAEQQGGSFTNNRNLCTGNVTYPVFTVRERPDFILFAPEFIRTQSIIWQEVAP